jgi:5'-3' exonuclease
VARGDRDSFQLASLRTMILYPSRGGELARIGPEEVRQRYGVDPNQVPDFIALRGTLLTNCPALPESGQNAPLNWCDGTERSRELSEPVSFKHRLRCSASIG